MSLPASADAGIACLKTCALRLNKKEDVELFFKASPLTYDQGEGLLSCLWGADLLPSPLMVLAGSTMGCDKATMESILPQVPSICSMPRSAWHGPRPKSAAHGPMRCTADAYMLCYAWLRCRAIVRARGGRH